MSAGLAVGERVVVIEPRHELFRRVCTVIEPQDQYGMVTVRWVMPTLWGAVDAQVYWTSARRIDASQHGAVLSAHEDNAGAPARHNETEAP